MKAAVSYYGGKQRIASKIVPLIPRHTVYVEPFCGGAAVFFAKPWPGVTNNIHYQEVLNDADGRIVNFYRQLRDNGEELCRRLALTPFSEAEYHEAKNLEGEGLEAARRYFVNSQQSFAKKLNGGWRRAVFGRNEGATWAAKVASLPDYIARMSGVHLSCTDALKCIKQFDSPQTFFYCDPPYPGTDQGHYKGYTHEDFKALVETLDAVQGSFILSCYECGVVVPEDWERHEIEAYCAASGKGRVGADRSRAATADELGDRKRTEVVYRRRAKGKVREEIDRLYQQGKFDCFA